MKSLNGAKRNGRTTLAGAAASRWKFRVLTLAVAGAGLSSMIASNAHAATKANNNNNLTLTSSWVGGVLPSATQTAVFDLTSTGATTVNMGGSMTMLGIVVLDPGGPITINDDLSVLSLGASGIDMSLAIQPLTINAPIVLTAAQNWTVSQDSSLVVTNTIDSTAGQLTVTGNGNTTISGVISGTSGFSKLGTGTLTLSAVQGYTGTTTIGGGTLLLDFAAAGSDNIISTSSPLAMQGGTLKFNGSGTQSFASTAFTTGMSVMDASGGTINLGTVTRNANGGSVRFTPGSTYHFGSGTPGPWSTFGLSDAATLDENNNVVGGDSVAGFWTLGTPSSSAQRFNNIPGGNLDIGSATGLYRSNTENPTINRIRFSTPTGGFQTGRDNNNGPVFVVRNTNRVTFEQILITPGVGAQDVFITDDTPINNVGPRINGNGMVVWQNNTAGFLVFNIGIDSSGSGAFVKAGAGTVVLNGQSTYAGPTVVSEGTLEIGGLGSLSSNSGSAVTINGGNLIALRDYRLTTNGGFSGTNKNMVFGSGGSLAAVTGAAFGVSGTVSGAGGITIGMGATDATNNPGATLTAHTTVNGNGTVILAGANTYTGTTNVQFGTLQVSNITGSGTGTGNVIVRSGATLGGSGTIAGTVNAKSGSFIAPGDAVSLDPTAAAPNIGNLTIGGRLTLNSGVVLNIEPGDKITADSVKAIGTVMINIFNPGTTIAFSGGGTFDLVTVTGATPNMAELLTHFQNSSFVGGVGNNGSILNAQDLSAGFAYAFSVSGNTLQLKISSPAISSRWVGTGNWANGTGTPFTSQAELNWTYISSSAVSTTHVPQGAFDTAVFDGQGTSDVNVTGNIQVGNIVFNSGTSYKIAPGGGTLAMTAGLIDATINDTLGSHTISQTLNLNSNLRVTVANAGSTVTIGGAGGAGGLNGATKNLTVAGLGNTLLIGTNTYNNTTINSGTLTLGDGNTAGNLGTGTLVNNGLLVVNHSNNVTINTAINGKGGVRQIGTGTLILGAANGFTGGLVVTSGGNVQLGNASATGTGVVQLIGSATLDINGLNATLAGVTGTGLIKNLAAGNATLTLNTNGNSTFEGSVNQSAGIVTLVKSGSGELFFSSNTNHNYTGGTIINGGSILTAAMFNATGTALPGPITLNGGQLHLSDGTNALNAITLTAGANDRVDVTTTGAVTNPSATLSGTVSSGTLVYQMGVANDVGTLTLAGTNTAGGTSANLSQGRLIFSGASAVLNAAGVIQEGTGSATNLTVTNGALLKTTLATGDGMVLGTGGAPSGHILTLSTGGMVDIGALTFNLNNSSFTDNSGSFISSTTNLEAGGILKLGLIRQGIDNSDHLTTFNFNGGTLVAGLDAVDFFPTSIRNVTVNVKAGGAIIDTNGKNVSISQFLQGGGNDGGITKVGLGTLTINRTDNSIQGDTTVLAGLLVLGNSGDSSGAPLGTSGSGALNLSVGASLDLNNHNLKRDKLTGGGTIFRSDNVASAVTLTIGKDTSSTASGTFSGVILNGNGPIDVLKQGNGTQTFTGSNNFRTLTITGGQVVAGASGTFDFDTGHIVVQSNRGLVIGSGVSVASVVDINSTNVTQEFIDVPSGNGTLSGPVNRILGGYQLGITGSGSLTMGGVQVLNGATAASITRGNIIFAGNSAFNANTTALTVGGTNSTSAVKLTLQDSATFALSSLTLGNTSAQSSVGLTVAGNASLNLGTGTLNLFNGTGTNATGVVTVNFNGGNTSLGSFSKTANLANQGANINFNGGTITATQANAAFLPALTNVTASILAGGAKFNTGSFDIGIAAPLTGVGTDGGLTKSGGGTMTLGGNVNYVGATTVSAGRVVYTGTTNSIGAVTGAGAVTIATGSTTTSRGITANALTVNGTLVIGANDGTAGSVLDRTSKLALANLNTTGGKIDLKNNSLILTVSTGTRTADYNTARALVTAGLAGGSGITSSSLTASTTVAVAANFDLHKTSFGGITGLTDDALLIGRTVKGDASMDGVVNGVDLGILATNFGLNAGARWSQGDFSGDGKVDGVDLGILATFFGSSNPVPLLPIVTSAAITSVAAVPEPASLALLALGGAALLTRRRRSR
jgi:autotransporter-associated beta strand protein